MKRKDGGGKSLEFAIALKEATNFAKRLWAVGEVNNPVGLSFLLSLD